MFSCKLPVHCSIMLNSQLLFFGEIVILPFVSLTFSPNLIRVVILALHCIGSKFDAQHIVALLCSHRNNASHRDLYETLTHTTRAYNMPSIGQLDQRTVLNSQ